MTETMAEVLAEYPNEKITGIQPHSFRILDSQDGFYDLAEVEAVWAQV